MRILAVGAHPDDVELQCAGTLARCAARGDQVFIAVSTNGEAGSSTLGPVEIAACRQAESKASAALIGAELIWMGFRDEFLIETEAVRLAYIDLVRRVRPDVVITHDPSSDYHPDHLATGQILWNTRVMTSVPNIKTDHPPVASLPDLYFMDTLAGINFQPALYVDVSDTFSTKQRMLAAHASQEAWLRNHSGMSYLQFMETCAAFRGLQAGVKYAEAFRRAVVFPAASGAGRELPGVSS
jgi:LmbE family N-acetylglucosaminyl deacetylase